MTRKRVHNNDTVFGDWLRKNSKFDSQINGYTATDVDLIWFNYKTRELLVLEEKTNFSNIRFTQKVVLDILDTAFKSYENYKGFFLLQFEKTGPLDGKIKINHIEATIDELELLLAFDKDTIEKFKNKEKK